MENHQQRPDDLVERARNVIDGNAYMVLGTIDPDGAPRVSPVYFGVDRYTDFYWISSQHAHHSANIAERDRVSLVIFDSTVIVGHAQAVYVSARAHPVSDADLADSCKVAFRSIAGGRAYGPEELSGDEPFRLYVAHAETWEVHVSGRDPLWGNGIDRRMPVSPSLMSARGGS